MIKSVADQARRDDEHKRSMPDFSKATSGKQLAGSFHDLLPFTAGQSGPASGRAANATKAVNDCYFKKMYDHSAARRTRGVQSVTF